MARPTESRFAATAIAIGIFTFVLLSRPVSSNTPIVAVQAETQLVPLVTDQTPLALPDVYGVPGGGGGVVNQAGDYAFFGNGVSAMFYRRAAVGTTVRVIQAGDELPGYPESRADTMPRFALNSSALLAFQVDFAQANGVLQGGIFSFDGSSLQRIVAGDDTAPGGGGAKFERGINIVGINDSGAIAFSALLVPNGSFMPAQTTLYIVPSGGAPVRVAGLGDAAPGTTGGTFGSFAPLGFNNLGEILFRANIAGGSGGQGLFVGTTSEVRKIVASDDARPEGGVFPIPTTAFLNNSGQVAFQAASLYINTPGIGNTLTVSTGDAVPAPVGGAFGSSRSLQALGDAGDIAFISTITGTAVSNLGLFRFRPGIPVELVAYSGQAAAGAPAETFSNFGAISINSTGEVAFRGTLAGGSVLNGIYRQTDSNAPVNIALDGQATTLAGGGTYFLMPGVASRTQTLNDGAVFFRSDVDGGTADFVEVLKLGGVTTVLMSTADTLPAGARISFKTPRVGAAGDFVSFIAQYAGGAQTIALHHITTQATTVLVKDGDLAPGTGGGRLRITNRLAVFLNASGNVVFSAAIIGGSVPGTTAILLASAGGGLTKVAASGDVDPGTGGTLSPVSLNQISPAPINAAGQVVFLTDLLPAVPGPSARAVFVWSPGTGLSKVAAVGDLTSSGGTISGFPSPTFVPNLSINSAGEVAFIATTGGIPGVRGIYVGSPGGTPAKVVAAGDPGPSGSTFLDLPPPSFNDSGEVAFLATLTGGPGGGVFLGSTSGPPVPLALNGVAAPAGGIFLINVARPDVSINNQHDVVFRANLTGGSSDSGYFVRRGLLGSLQAAVLQGQPAPGTTGFFETIGAGFNNVVSENFQLGPAGDIAFQSSSLDGGVRVFGTWHVKTNNTIEEILVPGTVAPEFGGGVPVSSAVGISWNTGGRYAVWARVSGGTFTDGIFLFVPVVGTNTPAGTSIPQSPTDATTGTVPVSMTFDNVTQAGETSLTTSSGGPAIPAAFALGDPPVFYNIETTATFSGSIAVCIDFSSLSFPPGSTLRLLHFEGGVWVDVTTSGPSGNIICGSVTSLSPFTVVQMLRADLAITKTVAPDPVLAGSHVTYTITVLNNGPDAAGGVVVSDNLPSTTAFVSCFSTGGGVCGGSGNNRTVTLTALAVGASATITLVANVNCPIAHGSPISNTATVSSSTDDSDPSSNSSMVNVTASNPITIEPLTLPSGTVGNFYNQPLTAMGGPGPFGFSLSAGAVPDGMQLSPAGLLSGTPTVAATFNFSIRAAAASGCYGEAPYSLMVASIPAYEADVAPRPTGSGSVVVSDWVQVGRFSVGLDTPSPGSEFQKADCAPRATQGDGQITVADWVQAGRYSVGLDPLGAAGGSTGLPTRFPSIPGGTFAMNIPGAGPGRVVRAISADFRRGEIGELQIELDASGNENALAFTLSFDARKATFLDAVIDDDRASNAGLLVNAKHEADGRVAIALALPSGRTFVAGTRRLLTLRFAPAAGEGATTMQIRFDDSLIRREIVTSDARRLPEAVFRSATVAIDGPMERGNPWFRRLK